MTKRLLCTAAAAALAACASANTSQSDPVDQRVVAVADGAMIQTENTPAASHEIAAAATAVWPALEQAYAKLGIPVVVNDPRLHRIGNTNFFKYGRMNGSPISAYANCGNGPTGARADNSRVYFSVITTVSAIDATHTRLSTDVRPVAVDMSGTSNARITCGSTGHLEDQLNEAVQAVLAGK